MNYQDKYNQGMSFLDYNILFESLVKEGRTNHKEQKESYINYTKLNWSRAKRTSKFLVNQDKVQWLDTFNTIKLLVITEPWCGDSAFGLPVINKFASDLNIELKILLRDEHLDLINLHLTNGGMSIPKLLLLNQNYEVLGDWGPRPSSLQDLVMKWKYEDQVSTEELQINVQKWYNNDKGQSILNELLLLLNPVSSC